MSLVTTLDPRGLRPPAPPPQTHHQERERLPAFPRGGPQDRLERARAYRKAAAEHVGKLHREPTSGLSICRLIAECLDRLVRGLFEELSEQMQPPPGLSLAALGGYGRRETAPHSDVDLLLLRPPSAREEAVRPFAKAFNTLLWDCKLVVGWSVRTPAECARAAEEDHTVRTALLDCRLLAGGERVYSQLADQVLRELLTHAADRFIADKSRELRERRLKYGDSIYLLEPNIKAGEGGLRDLEAALWIAQARYRTRGLRALLKEAVLPASEVNLLTSARDFLLRIRNHLHTMRGRKEDRLTFDLQEEVARFLGYQRSEEGSEVERFMRHYYLSAKAIRTAADALIARCEEGSPRRPSAPERRVPPFKVFQGKLTLDGGARMLSDEPQLSLRLFRVADELGVPLYSWARDQVLQALPALEAARAGPAVVQELKALLGRPGTRGALLFELHDLGVLGAAVPEFGRVTALHHQHELYHVYTVDVHTLFAVRRLYALRAGDLQGEVPEISREMQELPDPLPLYLGMLLHDVGKGLGGNHAQRGKEIASRVAARLGLSPRQTEIVEHLVLHHLAMSETSQRRDLSDPDLIAQFAKVCGDVEKLTCLYVLTYADMCSVSPTTWNQWRARLLKELFVKARAHLLGTGAGADASASREAFEVRWRRALGPERAEAMARRLPERYFLSTPPERAVLHARLLDRAGRATLAAAYRRSDAQGCSELALAARDRPGLLALFAGVLSAHGLDILSAQIASTQDGLALDAFTVRATHGGGGLERHRWRRARADLQLVLEDRATVDEILRKHRGGSLLQRPLPRVQARVSVDNDASARFTVVDVLAQDRVGLLHAIARALHAAGAEIALAKVATEAHQAIDSFYVTAQGQKVVEPAARERLVAAVREAVEALPG